MNIQRAPGFERRQSPGVVAAVSVANTACTVFQVFGFRSLGLGFAVLGFRVQGLGFRVEGRGLRV